MSQLQFRSDDTIQWQEGYGSRADGDSSPSGTHSAPNTTFTGTEDAITGTVGDNTGFAIGDIVLIHQSRNGGDGAGVWQLNKIIGISSTTFTFKYKLTNDYATTAQILEINQNKNITVTGTLTAAAWDGSKGGIVALLGESIDVSGSIVTTGKGYRGGQQTTGSGASYYTYQGEGTAGAGTQSDAANGNGGGGGRSRASGGTGGHSSSGVDGNMGNSGAGVVGKGGSTAGNADLTVMVFGGGGGPGGTTGGGDPNNGIGHGGPGGGITILIGKNITITGSVLNSGVIGSNGGGSDYGGGSAGAGGSALLKGEVLILGSNLVTALGVSATATGDAATPATPSSAGRIHADYKISISGSTNPTIDSRQDDSLNDVSSFLMFL